MSDAPALNECIKDRPECCLPPGVEVDPALLFLDLESASVERKAELEGCETCRRGESGAALLGLAGREDGPGPADFGRDGR